MHFHALASFQQGVNINSVHRPCHMLELPRGNPLHTFSDPVCYQPTLFELPTTATIQVLLIASLSYHQLLLTFPSGWCAYFLALLSIFANAGILEHQDSPNWTNLELTQDYVLQARMLWIFNRRDKCCKKVFCVIWPKNRLYWVTNRVFWIINRVFKLYWLMFFKNTFGAYNQNKC